METAVFSFLSGLVTSGSISTASLVLVVILILCILSMYIFRPMLKKIKTIPSKDELEKLIKHKNEFDKDSINSLYQKLDKVLEFMDKIDDIDCNNQRELMEIRRDIETVKQILNQFQGAMLFNKPSGFGNMELK